MIAFSWLPEKGPTINSPRKVPIHRPAKKFKKNIKWKYFEWNKEASDVRDKYVRDQGMFGTNCKFPASGPEVQEIISLHMFVTYLHQLKKKQKQYQESLKLI